MSKPATFGLRLLAWLIDLTIIWLPVTGFWLILSHAQNLPEFAGNLSLYIVLIVIPCLLAVFWYTILLVHYFGATLGKMIVGLKITDQHGRPLTFKRNFFRHTTGYIFSGLLFGLGYLAIIKDPDKLAWHDQAVGSKVVITNNYWPVGLGILIALIAAHVVIISTVVSNFSVSPLPQAIPAAIQDYKLEQNQKAEPSAIPSLLPEQNSLNQMYMTPLQRN